MKKCGSTEAVQSPVWIPGAWQPEHRVSMLLFISAGDRCVCSLSHAPGMRCNILDMCNMRVDGTKPFRLGEVEFLPTYSDGRS